MIQFRAAIAAAIALALLAAGVASGWKLSDWMRVQPLELQRAEDARLTAEAAVAQTQKVLETERAHQQLASMFNKTYETDIPAVRARLDRMRNDEVRALARELSEARAAAGVVDEGAEDAVPSGAFKQLGADCSETTRQLTLLQEWVRAQGQ